MPFHNVIAILYYLVYACKENIGSYCICQRGQTDTIRRILTIHTPGFSVAFVSKIQSNFVLSYIQ